MVDYLSRKTPAFLRDATPTLELEKAIQGFDILKLAGLRNHYHFPYGFHHLCKPVLTGIQQSVICHVILYTTAHSSSLS